MLHSGSHLVTHDLEKKNYVDVFNKIFQFQVNPPRCSLVITGEKKSWMERQTDGRTDGRTDRQTDRLGKFQN